MLKAHSLWQLWRSMYVRIYVQCILCNSFTGGRERLECMTQVDLNMCLWERQEETMTSLASITGSSSTCRRRLAMWTTKDTSLAPRWGRCPWNADIQSQKLTHSWKYIHFLHSQKMGPNPICWLSNSNGRNRYTYTSFQVRSLYWPARPLHTCITLAPSLILSV